MDQIGMLHSAEFCNILEKKLQNLFSTSITMWMILAINIQGILEKVLEEGRLPKLLLIYSVF